MDRGSETQLQTHAHTLELAFTFNLGVNPGTGCYIFTYDKKSRDIKRIYKARISRSGLNLGQRRLMF